MAASEDICLVNIHLLTNNYFIEPDRRKSKASVLEISFEKY